MLAQNFKSAADLGISEKQKEALCKTLVLLETGKLKHAPMGSSTEHRSFSGQFNMNQWQARNECGTIACIGGTAEMIGDVSFQDHYEKRSLHELFYPDRKKIDGCRWKDITPSQAATALRSYLTTGDARWDLAVQSSPEATADE
jgi:hypothetical protein